MRIRLHHDDTAEDPTTWGHTKVISFNRRHLHFEDPTDGLLLLDKDREPYSQDPGLRSKLRAGTAFVLSCTEHGSVHWSRRGTTVAPYMGFDTASVAGLILLTRNAGDDLETRQREADGFLEVYNAWANGYTYGVEILDDEGEPVASLWGLYGLKDAQEQAKELCEEHDIDYDAATKDWDWE